MSSDVVRYNLLRLLGVARGLVLIVMGLTLFIRPNLSNVFVTTAATDILFIFFAIVAVYFALTAIAICIGGFDAWTRPWLPLLAVCGFSFVGSHGFTAFTAIKELVVIVVCLVCAWLLKELFKEPTSAGEMVLAGPSGSARRERESNNERAEVQKPMFEAVKARATFADVVGMQELKDRLSEAGQEIVAAGKKRKTTRNGILLTGDPGNGKSFMAEALAGHLKLPIIAVSFADLGSKWLNNTTENAVRIFADARAQAPCVLFIDEIDAVIRDRSSVSSSSEEGPKTTTAILRMLVNIRDAGVVVVAASNHLDMLDPAALREGRFDFKIEVSPPDLAARVALIKDAARKFSGLSFEAAAIDMAAKRWQGYSVARIKAVVEEAGREAQKTRTRSVSYKALQRALRTIQGRKGSIPEDTPTLDQIAMEPAEHLELLAVAERMKNIERVEEFGASVPTGLLFSGPPGTGKTLTARALAKTTDWAFLETSGNALIGEPSKIDELVKTARELRPVIIFLDEADDILGDRAYRAPHIVSATNRLLGAIDGAGGKVHDVLWVAATNHPEKLDSAAVRGGRFTEKFEFDLPTATVINAYVQNWKRSAKAQVEQAVTGEFCAELLEGQSIANIKEVLQAATNVAVSRALLSDERPVISTDDVVAGLRRVTG